MVDLDPTLRSLNGGRLATERQAGCEAACRDEVGKIFVRLLKYCEYALPFFPQFRSSLSQMNALE